MKVNELFEDTDRKDLVDYTNGALVADPKKAWRGILACSHMNLTSLKGAPMLVISCAVDNNKLTSLIGAPKVEKYFNCSHNLLTSLEGAPAEIGEGGFDCSYNPLTSLEHAPKKILGAIFWCANTKITSLHNVHKMIEQIDGEFFAPNNKITSHVLGLLKIKNLTRVTIGNHAVENIIGKYLPEGDIVECQQELIEAGFDEYAQL